MTDPIPLSAVHAVCERDQDDGFHCLRCTARCPYFREHTAHIVSAIAALRAAGWTVEAGNSVTRSSADSMEGET